MKKLTNGIYEHRGFIICRDNQGRTWIYGCIHLFQTYWDAKNYIDLKIDGTNKSVPRIVGEWQEENYKEIQKTT